MARLSEMIGTTPQAAAPAAGGPAPVSFAAEIPLSKRIHAHTEDLSVLRLRVPTYADLMDIGEIDRVYVLEMDPITNRPTKMETIVDRIAAMRWTERLTGLDQIVLSQLSMQDGIAVEAALRRIIGAAQKGN